MFCDNCGAELPSNSVFCDNCGFSQKQNPSSQTKTIRLPSSGLLKKMGAALFLVALSWTYFQLEKTQSELSSLKLSTNEVLQIQTQRLSQSQAELKEAQTRESTLETAIKKIQAEGSSAPGSNVSGKVISALSTSVVKIYCYSNASQDSIQQGSGVLYRNDDGSYFVETNLHVVDTEDGSQSRCGIVVYPNPNDYTHYLVFGSHGYRYYNSAIDVAFLDPEIETNANAGSNADLKKYSQSYSGRKVCSSISVGDHISVLGYPGIGGKTLTVTDGIVSGFEFEGSSRYIKTSAKIDHGNSGGVAIEDSGCVVGIPSFAESGQIESIGRILDLNYLFNIQKAQI